jgi:hypothetical protein
MDLYGGRWVVTMLDVNGAQLFMQEIGVGPVALVLHGGLGVDQQPYRGLDSLATMLHRSSTSITAATAARAALTRQRSP